MSEQWEAPIVELGPEICNWIVRLMVRDLSDWGPERKSRLTKAEATALCMYLADHMTPAAKLEVAPVPPLRIAS